MIPVLGGPEEGLVSWIEVDQPTPDWQDLDGGVREPPHDAAPLIDSADRNLRFPAWLFAVIAATIAGLIRSR